MSVASDAGRGQSLVDWATARGRAAAATVTRFLEGGMQLSSPEQGDHSSASKMTFYPTTALCAETVRTTEMYQYETPENQRIHTLAA